MNSAIVKSLYGSRGSVTNSVKISRIPALYDNLISAVKDPNFLDHDFVKKVQ